MASTVWRGHLTFGLISIPVRLFRAARAEKIPLKRVARVRPAPYEVPSDRPSPSDDKGELKAPGGVTAAGKQITSSFTQADDASKQLVAVRQGNLAKDSGFAVPESAVTRAVEVKKNQFVEVPVEELKALKAETSSELDIQEFVPLAEIDPLYFETSYYIVPEEVGERAYALLYQSLINVNVVALAHLSMHGRDHVVVVRPGQVGLVAHTMFYPSEVHLDEQFRAGVASVNKKEVELAETLISSLTTTFEPAKYKNGYNDKLQQLIAGKLSGIVPETASERVRPAEVVDIADALRKSLAQLKKPVHSEPSEVRQPSVTRGKKVHRTTA